MCYYNCSKSSGAKLELPGRAGCEERKEMLSRPESVHAAAPWLVQQGTVR
jgi:hypothetical protein